MSLGLGKCGSERVREELKLKMQVGPKTENVKNIFTYRLHWVVLRVFIIMKRVFSCFKFELLGLQPLFRPDGS